MIRWLVLRLAAAALVVVAVSGATFALDELAPGEPLARMRLDPHLSPESLDRLVARYGLDQPLPVRYGLWLAGVLRGDLGHSFSRNLPVANLLWPRASATLLLTSVAMACAWVVAGPLGVWAAVRRHRRPDRAIQTVTTVVLSVPELVLAVGVLLLAARTGWLPTGGWVSTAGGEPGLLPDLADRLRHLVAPSLVLAAGALPVITRHVRAAMVEALNHPAVAAARSCGLSPARIVWGHALPLAAPAVLALLGLSVAGLLSASLVVETVFSWPGLGPLLLAGIHARDVHLIVAAVVLSCAVAVLGNLLGDLLLRAVDPRLRTRETA